MTEVALLYPALKHLHLGAVGLSLLLFAGRWLGVLAQGRWPMRAALRHTSVMIDVVLLAAGLSLWLLGGWGVWQSPWLVTKMLLLVVYVLLGSWALKRARSRAGHLLYGLAALAVAAQMVGVALMHHPGGWVQWLLR